MWSWFYHDRLLLGATLCCAVLLAFQLALTVLRPAWAGPVTDWMRLILAWPAAAVVAGVSVWLVRARRADAVSWLLISAALISYATARTLWSLSNQLVFHHGVPFPSVPDIFFILQYPFFILAVLLIPYARLRTAGFLVTVDSLLVIVAAAGLLWAFLLQPMYGPASGIQPLSRTISLGYQLADLFLLCSLTLTLFRPCRFRADGLVLSVLILAFACLLVADSWAGLILIAPENIHHVYRSGEPPDLFWMAFYLLLPLASLLRLRIATREPAWNDDFALGQWTLRQRQDSHLLLEDLRASVRLLLPLVVALLVSTLILSHTLLALRRLPGEHVLMSLALCGGLLLLVLVRQLVISVQQERVRRERETAQVSATILRQTLAQMDEFLATAAHDLRTPMGAVVGYLDLASREGERFLASPNIAAASADLVERVRRLGGYVEEASKGAMRTSDVLNRILTAAQAHAGKLEVHPEPCDLARVVAEQVGWMRIVHPRRPFILRVSRPPSAPALWVMADPVALGQVVANYLTNAVKYSAEDEPVEVRVTTQGYCARVEVRDHGPGVPRWEQERIWERYYRVPGIGVRTGSNVGLGIGLHICKLIVTQLGGQVGVESELGSGSTFWFRLPLLDDRAEL